jgi:hypothetical protein
MGGIADVGGDGFERGEGHFEQRLGSRRADRSAAPDCSFGVGRVLFSGAKIDPDRSSGGAAQRVVVAQSRAMLATAQHDLGTSLAGSREVHDKSPTLIGCRDSSRVVGSTLLLIFGSAPSPEFESRVEEGRRTWTYWQPVVSLPRSSNRTCGFPAADGRCRRSSPGLPALPPESR